MHLNSLGKLYVVATPIGNLEDFSIRAQQTLNNVSWVACEDTRHCKPLLNHYAINSHCLSLHSFNEKKNIAKLIEKLEQGESGAIISDAGTPVISDPGYYLIEAAHKANIQVVPIPGPNAAIAALSGLAVQEGAFHFEGFLPAKPSARKNRLNKLKPFESQLVFYEAPHRIKSLINDLVECLGSEREAGIARELTKVYESLYRGKLSDLAEQVNVGSIPAKGEFVVIVSGNQTEMALYSGEHIQLVELLLEYLPIKQTAKLACQLTGLPKKDCYNLALMVQGKT